MRRVLLGGLLAGIALYVWGALSHMVLGTLDRSVKPLPNESALLDTIRANVPEPGFYIYPMMDMRATGAEKEAQEARWKESYERGPRGVLVVEPSGLASGLGPLFLAQLFLSILAGLVAAVVVGLAAPALPTYGQRVFFTMLLGVLASVFVDLPYRNWYLFPTSYTVMVFVDRTVAFLVAGLVLGKVFSPRAS